MGDIFTKAKRFEVMSRVRSRGNRSTELRMISIFRSHGISGWRRNRPVFGRPDFVFPAERVAVFVDGCFWHGCPWHGRVPASNVAFWTKKFEANQRRDRLVTRTLKRLGWRVVRVWEHALSGDVRRVAARVMAALASIG